MLCKTCGVEIPDDTRFCPVCGCEVTFGQMVTEAAEEFLENAEQEFDSAIVEVQESFSGAMPSGKLKADRGLISYILLSIITLGIYSYYFLYKLAKDVNVACEGDGDKTRGLVGFILLSIITCGIYAWIWYYGLGNRLAENAPRYGMHFQENGTTILLWLIFGALLCGIGPFVAMHILIKNSNRICDAYNRMYGFM